MVKQADETVACRVELQATGVTMDVEAKATSRQAAALLEQILASIDNDYNQMLLPEFCTEEQFEQLRAETVAQVAEFSRGQLVCMYAAMAMWNAQQAASAIRQSAQSIMLRVDPTAARSV